MNDYDWTEISANFSADLVQSIRNTLLEGTTRKLDITLLAAENHVEPDQIVSLFDALAAKGVVEKVEEYQCPNCSTLLGEDQVTSGECWNCHAVFDELGEHPKETIAYINRCDPRRSVPWVITLHGMNTRGAWQEEFSWRVATKYRYSAPVAVYKYGYILSGAVLRFRQRTLVRGLGERIKSLVDHAHEYGFEEPPDIIAHSFGTWLFGHLLAHSDYVDLKFGRVLLAGCILRPDFTWQQYIEEGRVEAVLNHYGTADLPVRIAHWFIPGSGPAGRIGFSEPGPLNVAAQRYSHSEFFAVDRLRTNLSDGGLWERFLTLPAKSLCKLIAHDAQSPSWKASSMILRETPRVLALLLAAVITLAGCLVLLLGLWQAWDLLLA